MSNTLSGFDLSNTATRAMLRSLTREQIVGRIGGDPALGADICIAEAFERIFSAAACKLPKSAQRATPWLSNDITAFGQCEWIAFCPSCVAKFDAHVRALPAFVTDGDLPTFLPLFARMFAAGEQRDRGKLVCRA